MNIYEIIINWATANRAEILKCGIFPCGNWPLLLLLAVMAHVIFADSHLRSFLRLLKLRGTIYKTVNLYWAIMLCTAISFKLKLWKCTKMYQGERTLEEEKHLNSNCSLESAVVFLRLSCLSWATMPDFVVSIPHTQCFWVSRCRALGESLPEHKHPAIRSRKQICHGQFVYKTTKMRKKIQKFSSSSFIAM